MKELLPLMISSSTYVEVFHTLLDLPLLVAALERVEYDKSFREPGSSEDEESLSISCRSLFLFLLRRESGVIVNYWDSEVTASLLNDVFIPVSSCLISLQLTNSKYYPRCA